jgi:uncharacterized protein YuzE
MNIKYFRDTDTLYIELRQGGMAASRDLDEDTLLDVDAEGNICAITIEHASDRADILHFSDVLHEPTPRRSGGPKEAHHNHHVAQDTSNPAGIAG